MNNIKLSIIDDNKDLISLIKKYFKNHKEIEVVFEATTGKKEIRLISKDQEDFDFIVFDLIMTNKDEMTLPNNMHLFINKTLHALGIPSHIKGYQYIKEGIVLVYFDPRIVRAITKELYPKIANKYEASVSSVEKAIRHAIDISWNRGDWELMEELFGNSIDVDKAKPTNSEYIITIADKIRLDYTKLLTKF